MTLNDLLPLRIQRIGNFYLALSKKLHSNLSQASWAFVWLGHSPPERGLLIVSTIIKYVREIKTDVSAKPPIFGCYTWLDLATGTTIS